jgi:hypothetical protein
LEANALFRVYQTVGASEGVVYLSVPITSGRRELDLLERLHCARGELVTIHRDRWIREVVQPNEEAATLFAKKTRARYAGQILVEPSPLTVDGWSQPQYHDFWTELIRRYARLVVVSDGWEFSRGCRREVAAALAAAIRVVDAEGRVLEAPRIAELDRQARSRLSRSPLHESDAASYLEPIAGIEGDSIDVPLAGKHGSLHYKDAVLDVLAESANVAQYVSFTPGSDPVCRYCRMRNFDRNHAFVSVAQAVGALLHESADHSVNVRSFDPAMPKGQEFVYGIRNAQVAEAHVARLAAQGLYTIVNETIDVGDGGVSGVVQGDLVEFAPGDTPRCVDKPGTVALTRQLALRLLETVYGFPPLLQYPHTYRVEFSVHPVRRGLRHEHTIIWEMEEGDIAASEQPLTWPNRFSQLLGDKVFGLLVADHLGLPVPTTTVVGRRIAPFTFGRATGSGEWWLRTAPRSAEPGRFPTKHGWIDPFELIAEVDSTDESISSVLAQAGVDPSYSGAFITNRDGSVTIEGVRGPGDRLMIGDVSPEPLPESVVHRVTSSLHNEAVMRLGPLRVEWVYDGDVAWVVQLQQLPGSLGRGRTIVAGRPTRWEPFDVREGLEALRTRVATLDPLTDGVLLLGDVGVTSHFGDILRRARIASRIETTSQGTAIGHLVLDLDIGGERSDDSAHTG